MGYFTAPKQGRSRQGFAGDHSKVLMHGVRQPATYPSPPSQDCCANLKGAAWSLSKNRSKAR